MSKEIMPIFGSGPAVMAAMTADLFDNRTKKKEIHALWAYPLNGIVTILAIAVQPILSVVALIAAAIFKLIGCCSTKFDESATKVFQAAVCGFAARSQLFVRIFNPTFSIDERFQVRELEDAILPEYWYEDSTFSVKDLIAAPAFLAATTGKLCMEYTEENGAHARWTYPLNGIVTILAIAVQPILSVIGIVAAAIFRQLGCCSEKFDNLSYATFEAAIGGFTARPELFVRIFDPSFSLDYNYDVDQLKYS